MVFLESAWESSDNKPDLHADDKQAVRVYSINNIRRKQFGSHYIRHTPISWMVRFLKEVVGGRRRIEKALRLTAGNHATFRDSVLCHQPCLIPDLHTTIIFLQIQFYDYKFCCYRGYSFCYIYFYTEWNCVSPNLACKVSNAGEIFIYKWVTAANKSITWHNSQ